MIAPVWDSLRGGSAQWFAHLVQEREDLAVRLKHAGLMIRDVVLLAIRANDALRLWQITTWHRREEVVLDLVVETAVPLVGDETGADVARGQHLAAQEVNLSVM